MEKNTRDELIQVGAYIESKNNFEFTVRIVKIEGSNVTVSWRNDYYEENSQVIPKSIIKVDGDGELSVDRDRLIARIIDKGKIIERIDSSIGNYKWVTFELENCTLKTLGKGSDYAPIGEPKCKKDSDRQEIK